MTKRIFLNILFFGLVVFLVCAILSFSTLYSNDRFQTAGALQAELSAICSGVEGGGEEYLRTLDVADRITWVAADGAVLYDSAADPAQLANHLEREEIAQAMAHGTGYALRTSSTDRQTNSYYARRMSDGSVLRLCRVQPSALAMVLRMVSPAMWITLILLVLLGGALAFRLAKKVVKPIHAMNPENPDDSAYQELQPLVDRLQEQNRTIRVQLREISARQREFAAITENMQEGFLLVDEAGNILSGNRSALRLLNIPSGTFPTPLWEQDCPPVILEAVSAALSGTRAERLLDMGDITWQAVANPVISGASVGGAVLLLMDVTEREQREALRREFSANVSHELKTPLTSISGFAELMQQGLVPQEKMQEFSADIYKESRRLMMLVEDIIQLSRLDEESRNFPTAEVDLYAVCADILQRLSPVAEKQHIRLQLNGQHATVQGVLQLLEELVYNLADNAIKYNVPNGAVSVSVWQNGSTITLSVVDTGIGIPYADQDRVFERFYRVDKSHSKEVGGTGLGLSIVKHAAQYHNARLELKSDPGKGTAIAVIFG